MKKSELEKIIREIINEQNINADAPEVDRDMFDKIVISALRDEGLAPQIIEKVHPIFWFIFIRLLLTPGVLGESKK
jgi:hypothetical protein